MGIWALIHKPVRGFNGNNPLSLDSPNSFKNRKGGKKKDSIPERAFVIDPDGEVEYNLAEAFEMYAAGAFQRYRGPMKRGNYIRHEFYLD